MQSPFEVIVGNIGTVYSGSNYMQASAKYSAYVAQSKSACGRAGNEPVTLLHNGEIKREHLPPEQDDDIGDYGVNAGSHIDPSDV